jgi:hypothetical protein
MNVLSTLGVGRLLILIGLLLEFISVWLTIRKAFCTKEQRINNKIQDPSKGPVGD